MLELFALVMYGLFMAWIGYQRGHYAAHKTIATECKRLGRFYVDREVFECSKIVNKESLDYDPTF